MQDRETAHRLPLEFALSQLRHGYQQLHEHRVSRRGMREFADGIIAPAIRRLEQALASPLSAPPQVDVVALARAYRALVEHVAEQQATPDESWRAQADSLDRMLELEAALTKAALDKAKRRALTIFDTWLRVTGAIPAGSSWVCEAESCIEDAVEIGVQAAYGIHRPLESESDAAPPQEPTPGQKRMVIDRIDAKKAK